MYHERTYSQIRKGRIRIAVRIAFAAAVVALVVVLMSVATAHAREQGVISTREAIVNAAKQCCAVEGAYPASISYLEDHYGLVVNRGDYVISYEWFAGNIMPTVVVTAR